MNFSIFSEEFKVFQELRNDCLQGLLLCSFTCSPDELKKLGYQLIRSEFLEEKNEDHEFHEFKKGAERVVYLESYIDKEGGMFMQSMYSNPAGINTLKTFNKTKR